MPVPTPVPVPIEVEFTQEGAIRAETGRPVTAETYVRTLISQVNGALRLKYTGYVRTVSYSAIYGYDEDKNPLRELLPHRSTAYEDYEVNIDDDIKFIRACASISQERKLTLYFD